jgi:hypothetical protein
MGSKLLDDFQQLQFILDLNNFYWQLTISLHIQNIS